MTKKPERTSGMTKAALHELMRRHSAGEDMRGPFSLKTGKPIKQSPELAAINEELSALFTRIAGKEEG